MSATQRKPVVSLAGRDPYKLTAQSYLDAGWLPMPLPPKRKENPPTGYTGWDNDPRKVSQKQVKSWISSAKRGSNICHRPGHLYIGIDVDAYKAQGDKTYHEIIREIGELPPTWISSARADGKSGIRHYRLPEGYDAMAWPGTVGEAIQFVHIGHRYPVLPPSMHPEGMAYQWYEPGAKIDGNGVDDGEFPALGDLPELPVEIIDYFTKGRFARHLPAKDLGPKSKATRIVSEWIAERSGEPCAAMLRVLESVTDEFEAAAAHDTSRDGFYRLACLSAEGHSGLSAAASALHDAFLAEVGRDDRDGTPRSPAEAEAEWLRHRDDGVKKVMRREDDGEFIGHACTCTALAPDGTPKPAFNVTNYYLPDVLRKTYAALRATAETDWDGLYARGEQLWQVRGAVSRGLTLDALRGVVARGTDWTRPGGEDRPPAFANPPRDVLSSLLEDESLTVELPGLRGVVSTPFWARVDGRAELVHENGYHAPSQILLRMGPAMSDRVADVRGRWVTSALAHLDDVLVDFPFAGQADKAAAIAAMLQPFVRDLIAGPCPLFLIDAPQAGTGKSMLTELISIPACDELSGLHGFQRIAVTDDRNRNVELTKEINARMTADPRVVILDNVNGKFTGGALSSALTSQTYQVRVLGASRLAEVENRALWMMTANNPDISEELTRRIVPCRLNARVERPEERHDWTHENLMVYAQEKRDALVWSLLVLVQNWVEAGEPAGSLAYNSYPQWARVMSGILDAAGVPGLMVNAKSFRDRVSRDVEGVQGFIDEWWSLHRGERVRAADLVNLDNSTDLVPEDAKNRTWHISRKLPELADRVFGEFTVMQTSLDGTTVYYLQAKDQKSSVKRRRKRA